MKLSLNAVVIFALSALNTRSVNAFVQQNRQLQKKQYISKNEAYSLLKVVSKEDEAQKSDETEQRLSSSSLLTSVLSTFTGLALTVQAASAIPILEPSVDPSTFSSLPTTLIGAGAYLPEDTYMSTDLSLPKYVIKDEEGAKINEKEKQKQKSADSAGKFDELLQKKFNFEEPTNAEERKAQNKARAALKREMEIERIRAEKAAKASASGGGGASSDGGEKLSGKEKKELAIARAKAKREAEMQEQIAKREAAKAATEAKSN